MTNFIYRPRSGDRVFTENPANTYVVWVRWPNGCRHVFGGHHLSYSAAQPGQHWRTAARRMATILVSRFGGIAWDDQGEVNLVVPLEDALLAHRYMVAAARHAGVEPVGELDGNEVGLLLAGYEPTPNVGDSLAPAYLAGRQQAIVAVEVAEETRWRECQEGEEPNTGPDSIPGVLEPITTLKVTFLSAETGDPSVVTQTAPANWGTPQSSPPALLRQAGLEAVASY